MKNITEAELDELIKQYFEECPTAEELEAHSKLTDDEKLERSHRRITFHLVFCYPCQGVFAKFGGVADSLESLLSRHKK